MGENEEWCGSEGDIKCKTYGAEGKGEYEHISHPFHARTGKRKKRALLGSWLWGLGGSQLAQRQPGLAEVVASHWVMTGVAAQVQLSRRHWLQARLAPLLEHPSRVKRLSLPGPVGLLTVLRVGQSGVQPEASRILGAPGGGGAGDGG